MNTIDKTTTRKNDRFFFIWDIRNLKELLPRGQRPQRSATTPQVIMYIRKNTMSSLWISGLIGRPDADIRCSEDAVSVNIPCDERPVAR